MRVVTSLFLVVRDCSAPSEAIICLNDYLFKAYCYLPVKSPIKCRQNKLPNCTAKDAITRDERKYSDGELHKQNA